MGKIINFLISNKDIIALIISLFSILLTYLTFRLAEKVHKEFAKNHTKAKQVEVMCELVKSLNNSKIEVQTTSSGGSAREVSNVFYNIFELGNLLNTQIINQVSQETIDFKKFDDNGILFEGGSNQLLDIKKFIDNPFLPKKIANKLMPFYCSSHKTIKKSDLRDNNSICVILKTDVFENNQYLQQHNMPTDVYLQGEIFINNGFALITWLNVKTYAKQLTKEIDCWFKENGIEDVNLRIEDYKNIS